MKISASDTVYAVSKNLQRTRYYMGGCWTFLCKGEDNNGKFALMEIMLRKGLEPPRHTHTKEDETYYLLEGAMEFSAGEQIFTLQAGDCIHLPSNIPHHFKLKTDTAKILVHVAPAGLEEMFWELSRPADRIDFPPMPAGPPDAQFLEKLKGLQAKYGIAGIDNNKIKTA
jgi:quercetin dioxygenase-like cupin family protein